MSTQQNSAEQRAFLARTMSTERMVAASYSDYCQSVVENFSNLLEIVTKALDGEYSRQTLSEYNYPISANIFLNRQTCSVDDLLMDIQESSISDDESESDDLFNTPLLKIRDNWKYDTVEEVLEELNCSFHAICSEAAIAQGFKMGGEVSERITIARDYIMQKFSSGYTDFSGSLEYAIESMKDSINVTDWISRIMKNDGLDDLANEVIPDIEQSDAFKYSGASASSAYCWDTVGKAAVATVAVAAKAVTGAIKGILSIGKKLFSKIKKKITEIVVNPYDLEKLDPKEEGHTVDGYHMVHSSAREYSANSAAALLSKTKLKEWYHTDWFCSEVMSRLTSINSQLVQSSALTTSQMSFREALIHLCQCYDSSYDPATTDSISDIATYLIRKLTRTGTSSTFTFPALDDPESDEVRYNRNMLILNLLAIRIDDVCSLDYIYDGVYWTNRPKKVDNGYLLQLIRDVLDKTMTHINYSPDSNGVYNVANPKPDFTALGYNNEVLYNTNYYTPLCYFCGPAMSSINVHIEELVRFKPVNYRFASTLPFGNLNTYDIYKMTKAFIDITNDSDPYADATDPEWFLFNSFQLGKLCHKVLGDMLEIEALYDDDSNPLDLYDYQNKIDSEIEYFLSADYYISNGANLEKIDPALWGSITKVNNSFPILSSYTSLIIKPAYGNQLFSDIPVFINSTATVSNRDFFNSAVGQYPTNTGYYVTAVNHLTEYHEHYPIMVSIIKNLYMQWKTPFSFPYWPYSKSLIKWFDPSFRIKTDQDNISAFNTFVTVAVIVAAVVVVGGITCTKLKSAAMKASLKEKGLSAQFAQKAAAGTLTKADLKTYKKAVKKANKLGKLAGNLNTPSVSTATQAINLSNNNEQVITDVGDTIVESSNTSLNELLTLITGQSA